jgi:hypothetical protein
MRSLEGQAAYLERIVAMDLYEPGTKSVYSDLGLILLEPSSSGSAPARRAAQTRVWWVRSG